MQDEITRILDKSAGIYERLGANRLLFLAMYKTESTVEAAAHAARIYASFLQDGYGPALNSVYDDAETLCESVGGLLAVLDVILAAADLRLQMFNMVKRSRIAYEVTLRSLEQSAREKGLPDDYSMARERAKRFRASGLVRPAFVEKESNNNP